MYIYLFNNMKTIYRAKPLFIVKGIAAFGLVTSVLVGRSQAAIGAEKVKLIYGPFNGRVSVKSLEHYAKESFGSILSF